MIDDKNMRQEKIDYLLSKFELENIKNKSKILSGGQKKLINRYHF